MSTILAGKLSVHMTTVTISACVAKQSTNSNGQLFCIVNNENHNLGVDNNNSFQRDTHNCKKLQKLVLIFSTSKLSEIKNNNMSKLVQHAQLKGAERKYLTPSCPFIFWADSGTSLPPFSFFLLELLLLVGSDGSGVLSFSLDGSAAIGVRLLFRFKTQFLSILVLHKESSFLIFYASITSHEQLFIEGAQQ